jgi:hypothetical protein
MKDKNIAQFSVVTEEEGNEIKAPKGQRKGRKEMKMNIRNK